MKLTQMEVTMQEFRDNARIKRREAEILIAEATVIDRCADRVSHAIDVDAARGSPPSRGADGG